MTDTVIAAAPVAGRSLWADAWGRLKANRAAVGSAIYIALMAIACIVGPYFSPHQFSTIYQDYVRVPPSFASYPRPDMIDQAVKTFGQTGLLEFIDDVIIGQIHDPQHGVRVPDDLGHP